MNRISDLSSPTIAALNGDAIGGGLELALACDFRFGSTQGKLGFPEIDLGMLPGWGGTQRLPAVVGESTAKDLLLTGRYVDMEAAATIGLVDRIFEEGDFWDSTTDYADQLAEKPAQTVAYILEAVRVSGNVPIEEGLAFELMNDMLASFTDEARERTEKFFE